MGKREQWEKHGTGDRPVPPDVCLSPTSGLPCHQTLSQVLLPMNPQEEMLSLLESQGNVSRAEMELVRGLARLGAGRVLPMRTSRLPGEATVLREGPLGLGASHSGT